MRSDPAVTLAVALTGAFACVVILRLLDLNEKEPVWALLLLLWLGAVAAPVAARLTGPGHADEALEIALISSTAVFAAVGAGLVALAVIGLVRGWSEVSGTVDGLVYGAAGGLGFAIGEGVLRGTFDSVAERQTPDQLGTWNVIWITIQSVGSEALFGAILGAALVTAARARNRFRSIGVAAAGAGAAFLCNLLFTGLVLENPQIGPSMTVAAALAVLILLAAVAAGVRHALRIEARAIADELEDEVGTSTLRRSEHALLRNPRRRHRSYWDSFVAGDLDGWLRQRALQDRQVRLALLKKEQREAPVPERNALDDQIDELKRSIARCRQPSGEWERYLGRTVLAGAVALVLLAGGTAVFAFAAGDEEPTTILTRSEIAAQEAEDARGEIEVHELRNHIRRRVGPFELVSIRENEESVGAGADEAYTVGYATDLGSRIRHELAAFDSEDEAAEYAAQLRRRPVEGRRRIWVQDGWVSSAEGTPRRADRFCQERQTLLLQFLSQVRASVPATWRVIPPTEGESTGFTEPRRRANVLGSSTFFPRGTIETYVDRQTTLLEQELPGFRQLRLDRVRFRAGGVGYRRVYDWQPPRFPVRQIQVYYVDDCGLAYQFTATATRAQYSRWRPLFDEVFSVLFEPPRF